MAKLCLSSNSAYKRVSFGNNIAINYILAWRVDADSPHEDTPTMDIACRFVKYGSYGILLV